MKEYTIMIEQNSWLKTTVEADSLEEAIELSKESDEWDNCDGEEATGKYEVYDENYDIIVIK